MTTSFTLTSDDFTSDRYEYSIDTYSFIRFVNVDEVLGGLSAAGILVEAWIYDSDSEEYAVTREPCVIGIPGTYVDIEPTSDDSLLGEVLTMDNLEDATITITVE